MFLSLVRPERISSPITNSAAVTSSREVVALMMILMRDRRRKGSLPCHCGRCGFKSPEAGNRNDPGDQVCSGRPSYRSAAFRSERENDDAHCDPPPWAGPQSPCPDHAAWLQRVVARLGAVAV